MLIETSLQSQVILHHDLRTLLAQILLVFLVFPAFSWKETTMAP